MVPPGRGLVATIWPGGVTTPPVAPLTTTVCEPVNVLPALALVARVRPLIVRVMVPLVRIGSRIDRGVIVMIASGDAVWSRRPGRA